MIVSEMMVPVWAEIDLEALKNNLKVIRTMTNTDTKIMGVVKFDAYGHGAVEIAKALVKNGIDALGVANVQEGVELKNAGIEVPTLILGNSFVQDAKQIVDHSLTPMVCSSELADALDDYSREKGKKLPIHLRVDTRDSKIGSKPEHFEPFLEEINKRKNLLISGIFTHLISAYLGDEEELKKEIHLFRELVDLLEHRYPDQNRTEPLITHAFSSPGIFRGLQQAELSMIRIGTGLYGLPSFENQSMEDLKPVMRLKSKIIDINQAETRTHMEYSGITMLKANARTAIIPVGYGHLPFLLLMKDGNVLINGKRASVLGGAFMGHMVIDITQRPEVKIGDEVVILGEQSNQRITAQEIAEKCGIGIERCESICFIDRKVKRVYIDELRGGC